MRYISILSFALLVMMVSCKKSKPTKESGEDTSGGSSIVYEQNRDSFTSDWGAPSPPPDVEGDGSSLFSERQNKIDVNGEGVSDYDNTSNPGAQTDVISNWINNRSTNSNSSPTPSPSTPSPRPQQRRQPSSPSTDYSLEYNWLNDPDITSGVTAPGQLLPYAANDDDKMDFLNDFYTMLFDRSENRDAESYMSMSCKNYLKENNRWNLPVETFFGINASNLGKPAEQTMQSMTIKPVGYDWYRINWSSESNNRSVDLKVIELNRKLVVDMIR